MQCDRRAGLKADLRIFETFAACAEHLVGGDAQIVDRSRSAWPPGIELSIVSSTRSMRIAGSGRSTRNMQAPSSDFAMTMPTFAPSAPVMKALRPLITQ